jgi:hypothetical protein
VVVGSLDGVTIAVIDSVISVALSLAVTKIDLNEVSEAAQTDLARGEWGTTGRFFNGPKPH